MDSITENDLLLLYWVWCLVHIWESGNPCHKSCAHQ